MKPRHEGELESQGLYGDQFLILEDRKYWYKVNMLKDGTVGWIKKENEVNKIYNKSLIVTHKVNSILTNVKKKPDLKSSDLQTLFFNSRINVINTSNNWAKVKFQNCKNNSKFGYVYIDHLENINFIDADFSKFIKLFLNAPYKWGGKSCLGIDCSGLIQIIYNYTRNSFFPRNSIQQELFLKNSIIKKNEILKNDLVFWKGHVGIMSSQNELIHATANKMLVVKEDLDCVIKRIKSLYNLDPKFYRLKI